MGRIPDLPPTDPDRYDWTRPVDTPDHRSRTTPAMTDHEWAAYKTEAARARGTWDDDPDDDRNAGFDAPHKLRDRRA